MAKNIFKVNLLVVFLVLISFAQAQKNVTYNVITAAPADSTVAVIVDNVTFPLSVDYGILYHGEAPAAKVGYSYAVIDTVNNNAILSEPFLRPPLGEGQSTPNAFFNRSIDKYDLVTLPQALEPLSSIHKIKSDLHIPNQIPSIHIYGNASAIDYLHKNQLEDLEVELSVTYISLHEVYTFDKVEVSLAGRSSRWVPKLSYGLKLDKKNDTTLFGYKNFKLRALANDPSYIRENVAYNVLKASGVPCSGFSYVRVFIDNQAVGLFGLIETFQDPWLSATFANGQDNYESGYLYQGISFNSEARERIRLSDLRYEGTDVSLYDVGQYQIKAGPSKKKASSYKDLQEFTKFINQSTTKNTSENEWEKKLDVEGFLRSMAIEDLLGFSDGYMTLSNNFYLYRDPNQGNRYTYIAADLDTTIGISIYNLSLMIDGDFTKHPGFYYRPLTKKIFGYDKYLNMYKDIYLHLFNNLVNPYILDPYIDSIVNMIRTDIDWDTVLPKMGNRAYPFIPSSDLDLEAIQRFIEENNPPGIMLIDITKQPHITFEISVNGPSPVNTSYSVKEFIAKKYEQITNFYH